MDAPTRTCIVQPENAFPTREEKPGGVGAPRVVDMVCDSRPSQLCATHSPVPLPQRGSTEGQASTCEVCSLARPPPNTTNAPPPRFAFEVGDVAPLRGRLRTALLLTACVSALESVSRISSHVSSSQDPLAPKRNPKNPAACVLSLRTEPASR